MQSSEEDQGLLNKMNQLGNGIVCKFSSQEGIQIRLRMDLKPYFRQSSSMTELST
jgi:hypothetical protein